MRSYKTARCARCGHLMEGNFYEPCPHCLREGVTVNYTTVYDLRGARLPEKKCGRRNILLTGVLAAAGERYPSVKEIPRFTVFTGWESFLGLMDSI